jgi:hypothetical protein
VEGSFEGMNPERTCRADILLDEPPTSVELNGNALSPESYRYEESNRILTVELGTLSKVESHRLRIRI